MAMKETLKNYAIGAGLGLLAYHYVLKKEFPSLPSLSVQKLIQENSFLRANTNQMMQKLATGQGSRAPRTYGMLAPDSDMKYREKRYGFMDNRNSLQAKPQAFGMIDGAYRHPEAKYNPDRYFAERQRRFGAMGFQQNPAKTERERRFGFASPVVPKLNPFGMK